MPENLLYIRTLTVYRKHYYKRIKLFTATSTAKRAEPIEPNICEATHMAQGKV